MKLLGVGGATYVVLMAKMSFEPDISGREHHELWRPIPDFVGYYEASNLGRVRSVDRVISTKRGNQVFRRGGLLSQRRLSHGYIIVMMSKECQYQNQLVHRLVLLAFRGEPLEGAECRHLNGVRSDNRLENLVWGTHSENSIDQVVHGTHRNISKTHCLRGHEFTPANTYIRPRGERMCRACRVTREEARKNMGQNAH